MKLNIRTIIFTSLFLLGLMPLTAQSQQTLKGKVTDAAGNPLPGVTILSGEAGVHTQSDANGEFSIKADMQSKLVVSASGFQTARISSAALAENNTLVLEVADLMAGEADVIQIPFGEITKRRVTGSINAINVQEELKRDQRAGINAMINGKVSGVFGGTNLWGTGNATIIVDGIPRDIDYLDMLEIESITVLKDAVAKAMYGSQADKGIILVTTKRGKEFQRQMRFTAEYGVNTPKQLPEYMAGADYMAAYNQAQINDGTAADQVRFSQEAIDATRSGSNPTRYPDEDYYGSRYLKNNTNFIKVFGDASGGNEHAQYYANVGWKHNQGWINLGQNDANDVLNMRGNVDFDVTNNLKMSLDAVANFEFKTMPNVLDVNTDGYATADFWSKISSVVPNAYPVLWDPNLITDEDERNSVLENATLVDGMLLGGNSVYTKNLYGDLTQNGNRKQMNRALQFNTAIDWDMSFITKGLSAKAYSAFSFYNSLITAQNSSYAVYEPVYSTDVDGNTTVSAIQHGEDVSAKNFVVKEKEGFFSRRFGVYGTLNYDRAFGEHEVKATALLYRDELKLAYDQEDEKYAAYAQDFVNLHYGVSANYMLRNKYLLDVAAVMVGSQKLEKGNRMGFAPAAGLGWIVSDEDFLSGVTAIDFLKLRTSFGIVKNDDWDNYYLYKNTFARGGNFNYNNNSAQNTEINYVTVANELSLQGRKEFSIGLDALLWDRSTKVELGYFSSTAYDQMTKMNNTYPNIMGYNSLIYNNYNSNNNKGIELGLEYNRKMGAVDFTVGTNMVYRTPKTIKLEEPFYADDAQYRFREGKQSDGIWGWKADGLYGASDFDSEGMLLSSLPQPTFGKVQAGDIKYLDLNNDNVIDEDDQDIIGNNQARFQYSAYIDLKFKKFELYAMGIGQTGQDKIMNGNYFWAYGDLKFSELMKDAYGPGNEDVNAAYPRLSTSKNSNNFRNSSYWVYDNNWFTLPVVQLTYHFGGKDNSILKNSRVYVRATDLITISANQDKADLNVDSAPQTRSMAVGFVTNF